MGASESKLVFKQGIFRLSEGENIAPDDPYWAQFWTLPESAEDLFSLFSPVDIRRARDASPKNFETLLSNIVSRLVVLKNHPSFPDPELAPVKEALNCVRILTRLLPFVYENDALEQWEEKFFWTKRRKKTRKAQLARSEVLFDDTKPLDRNEDKQEYYEDVCPLMEELIDTLVDLLFYSGFTIPRTPNMKSKITYSIWQSGIGCNTSIGTSKEYESNRSEILRLLLTITSKSMYMPPNLLPVKGLKALTYIVTVEDKQAVLSVLCSLLNTTMKYNPASWRLPYDHVIIKDPKQILVVYCLQLLLVLVLYPIPEEGHGPAPKNYYRHYLGRLHRPQDFQFIVDGMMRILSQPMQANISYLPGSQKSLRWAPEMIMLFWELLQANKRFRSFIVDTDRAHDFMILILFYALEHKIDPSMQGVVRMCVFVLQTLSVESSFGKGLNKTFEGHNSLPASIRIPNFTGSYADYLIISINTLITTTKGKLVAIYPALLAIINNIAPYVEQIDATTCTKLLQLFTSMSSPSFLLSNETNYTLLQALLEALNAIIEHQYNSNTNLLYAIMRSKRRFEALRTFTLKSAQEEIERLALKRKEGHSPDNNSSRNGSIDSLRSPVSSKGTPLSHVPEDGTFAIGEDDSDDSDDHSATSPRPTSYVHNSRTPSVSSSVDDAVPLQLRGMSEKARGKMPIGQASFSRQNSSTSLGSYATIIHAAGEGFEPSAQWVETWIAELPLHTILTVISALSPSVPSTGPAALDTHAILTKIRDTSNPFVEPSPIRIHLFEWSPLSLGWYESLLWGFIFTSEMHVVNGTLGVWNGTAIKLFKVQETAVQGPTLTSPRGAVDAVGSNIVQRIGNLHLRGRSVSQDGSAHVQNNGRVGVRDV